MAKTSCYDVEDLRAELPDAYNSDRDAAIDPIAVHSNPGIDEQRR
jgi:hypothetical protein